MKRFDLSDVLLFLGAACIVWGIAEIYTPAAKITAGAFMIVFAYLFTKEKANASAAKPASE